MKTIQILIGKNIKAARKKKKLTQVQLANCIGKKEVTIRKYENGTILIPLDALCEISKILDVLPSELLQCERWVI